MAQFKNNGKLKLLIIVGTRPEIIRLAAVINKCREYFDCMLAHTGQNYDYNLNGVFFKDLSLDDPDVYLDAVGKDLGETMGNIIAKSYQLMAEIKPDAVELAQKVMAENHVEGSEFEHKGKLYQLQVDETFDFAEKKERYNDAIAAQWRAKAEEQRTLKASVSALTSEMKGLLKSWRLQHPKRIPDAITYTFKVLKKKGDKKK